MSEQYIEKDYFDLMKKPTGMVEKKIVDFDRN